MRVFFGGCDADIPHRFPGVVKLFVNRIYAGMVWRHSVFVVKLKSKSLSELSEMFGIERSTLSKYFTGYLAWLLNRLIFGYFEKKHSILPQVLMFLPAAHRLGLVRVRVPLFQGRKKTFVF